MTTRAPARRPGHRHIEIRGTVQGVGFRPWVYRLAHQDHIRGRVRNDPAGVTIDAWGEPVDLEAFCRHLEAPPAAACVRQIVVRDVTRHEMSEPGVFEIVASRAVEGPGAMRQRLSIPPDLATCDDCLREVFDPGDRRYRYPFTNCTHCGPRFTLATGAPYDRSRTTMASFRLCPDCAREYADPLDRRFHAQPNACPVCGPHLWLEAAGEVETTDAELLDPLRAASRRLLDGQIVAVKGLGGFHLACLADSLPAVARLRRRKRRPDKPFAVMVRDLDEARLHAHVGADEATLLQSVERPIVLLRRRAAAGGRSLAEAVAPGLGQVGLLLPYTPLHHLLLDSVGRPLVMTSGNLCDEPIVHLDEDAHRRLGGVADAFLLHDRPIARPCDDSVARVVAGVPTVFRRSRGFTPRPIPVPRPFPVPMLACGAHLKNAVCLGVEDAAWFGPHVGDLETPEASAFLEDSVREMERLLDVVPEVIAHDLHPDYISTRFAERHAREVGARTIAVQHHHAHVLSAMAEHGLSPEHGPVLGVAFDGVGLGPDQRAWGGEILVVGGRGADDEPYRRLATLRPLPLAGGDQAVREPWRLALALLDDAFDGTPPLEDLALFRGRSATEIRTLRRLLERGLNAPRVHGAGRYFDAVGALLTARGSASYEGHLAMLLESLAAGAADRADALRPFHVLLSDGNESSTPGVVEIDLRPTLRSLVDGLLCDVEPAVLAARFHRTLAHGVGLALRRVLELDASLEARRPAVALTGGCFQNDLFTRVVEQELEPGPDGLRIGPVLRHRQVPPGDGGLALGQLMAALAAAV